MEVEHESPQEVKQLHLVFEGRCIGPDFEVPEEGLGSQIDQRDGNGIDEEEDYLLILWLAEIANNI